MAAIYGEAVGYVEGGEESCIGETFTRTVANGLGTSEFPGGSWTNDFLDPASTFFSVDGDEAKFYRPASYPVQSQYMELAQAVSLPFDITFTARWEKDAVTPGPPHGPSSAEAYGLGLFILSTPDGGDTIFNKPAKRPYESLGFRLNRDSDTLEDFLSFPMEGDGLGVADHYATTEYVPPLSWDAPFKVRWRVETTTVYLKVCDASVFGSTGWDQVIPKPASATWTGFSAWNFVVPLANESPAAIGFVEGVRLFITQYCVNSSDPPVTVDCGGGGITSISTLEVDNDNPAGYVA